MADASVRLFSYGTLQQPEVQTAADAYEVEDYERWLVELRGGGEAWVYAFADGGEATSHVLG